MFAQSVSDALEVTWRAGCGSSDDSDGAADRNSKPESEPTPSRQEKNGQSRPFGLANALLVVRFLRKKRPFGAENSHFRRKVSMRLGIYI